MSELRSELRSDLRTFVTFRAPSFNQSEVKEYFINPCCFGDDLARWLIVELQSRGVEVDEEPGQEDFGWYLSFRHNDHCYTVILGSREDETEAADWLCWIEGPSKGILFFGRKRHADRETLQLLHEILSGSDQNPESPLAFPERLR